MSEIFNNEDSDNNGVFHTTLLQSKEKLAQDLFHKSEPMNKRWISLDITPERRSQINSLILHDDIAFTKQGEHIHSFCKDITTLLEAPSKVELLLIKNEMLYVGNDGKLYFTPKAIQFYVPRALVSIGKLEEILWPWINLFGMPCIDGRYDFPSNFAELSLSEKIRTNVGSIPWWWAGMLMVLMASLRNLFDETDTQYLDYIREVITMILQHNKDNNADWYKIQRHTDLHPKHVDGFDEGCGCWFLTNAKADPESYGINSDMMDMVISILHDADWAEQPVVLWKGNKHLESHKERAAFVLNNLDEGSQYENFVLMKQIDFSETLTQEEQDDLNTQEKQELQQMAFTANFRSFPVLVSEAASLIVEYLVQKSDLIEKVVLSDKDKIILARDHNSYFDINKSRTTAGDAVLALMKNNIKDLNKSSTGHIKNKLSWAPMVTVDYTTNNMYEIDVTFEK